MKFAEVCGDKSVPLFLDVLKYAFMPPVLDYNQRGKTHKIVTESSKSPKIFQQNSKRCTD